MTTTVFIIQKKEGKVAKLPLSALFQKESLPAVWVYSPETSQVHLQVIEILEYQYDSILIQSGLENGQIVVALLDDGSATLKTYRRLKNGKVMLVPANPKLKPITLDQVSVQGKVIGVIREMI